MEDAFEPEPPCGAEYGGDVAVVEGAFDVEEFGEIADGEATLEHGTEALDDLGRERGEVAEGLLSDPRTERLIRSGAGEVRVVGEGH
ncbi:MAG: hypothetical protein OYK82_09945 [Gammaproteobacteria bacterium]|nr:hypothetical protein [Gammaproteobacteria bacterium]